MIDQRKEGNNMPNWAEGTIKLRGRAENIASALKYMFCDNTVTVTVKEEWDVPFSNLGG